MQIKPAQGKIYLRNEKPTAGSLDLSSKPTVVEYGEVLAIGAGVNTSSFDTIYKIGDKIFVKAWSLDLVTYNKEVYYFVDVASGGILATITE